MDYKRWFDAYKRRNPKAKPSDPEIWARYANYTATQNAVNLHNATLANPAAYGYSTPDTPQRIADPNWAPARSAEIDAEINRAAGRVRSRRTQGNQDRRTDTTDFQKDMIEAGYWMPTTGDYATQLLAEVEAGGDYVDILKKYGDKTPLATQASYKFDPSKVSAEGALYRQKYQQQLANAAASGQAGTSAMERGWRKAHRKLESERQSLVDDAAKAQRDSLVAENNEMWNNSNSKFGAVLEGEARQRDYRAKQTAPLVANPAYKPYVAPKAGTRDFRNSQAYGFDPRRSTLNSRFGAGNYSVNRDGNKWIVRW